MSQSWGTALVSIPADDDGMVGCQCPRETCRPRYFKIESTSSASAASSDVSAETEVGVPTEVVEDVNPSGSLDWPDAPTPDSLFQHESRDEHEAEAQEGKDTSDKENVLHCPYCGLAADRQQFFTPEQLEYAKSLILRHITGVLHQRLKQLERRPDSHAFLSIGISVRTSALPEIATYEENRLKQHVVCPHCQANYAVYGISFTCPRCGEGTLLWHLESTAHEIRVFLDMPDEILARLDTRSQEKLVENALEDVVSFWEGYLKALYRQAVRRRYDPQKAAQLEQHIGTTFQRLSGATDCFMNDLSIDILADVALDDIELLSRVFNKRHVLTHNLGLADERFLTQTHVAQQVGQEIEVTREETLRALDIVSKALRRADEKARVLQ